MGRTFHPDVAGGAAPLPKPRLVADRDAGRGVPLVNVCSADRRDKPFPDKSRGHPEGTAMGAVSRSQSQCPRGSG